MEKKKIRRGGLGIVGTLTLLFLVLKLTNIIEWPWIWVLCPIWIAVALAIILFAAILIFGRVKKGRW